MLFYYSPEFKEKSWMTYFHAIVKGSRLTTACQHWQGMCQIIYYTCFLYVLFPFFLFFSSFSSSSPHGKRKVFFSLLLFFSAYWRQSCLRGLSLRQHSNQKVALKLTAVPRIAELTLASWCCHITSSCAVKSWFKYQATLRKSWAEIWFFILYRSGFTFASNYYVSICPVLYR